MNFEAEHFCVLVVMNCEVNDYEYFMDVIKEIASSSRLSVREWSDDSTTWSPSSFGAGATAADSAMGSISIAERLLGVFGSPIGRDGLVAVGAVR
jgi:hypothetical protein